LGSEFGSRHWQYERFYAGPPYVVRDHSFREAPWEEFRSSVEAVMQTYDVPGPTRPTQARSAEFMSS
jgi:4-hydroxyphenylacetate 3-monooxygenase